MTITRKQAKLAVENAYEIGVDGSREIYDAVRSVADKAIVEVGTQQQKTQHYFNSRDWNRVYANIINKLK